MRFYTSSGGQTRRPEQLRDGQGAGHQSHRDGPLTLRCSIAEPKSIRHLGGWRIMKRRLTSAQRLADPPGPGAR
jgi:hypothetical protein